MLRKLQLLGRKHLALLWCTLIATIFVVCLTNRRIPISSGAVCMPNFTSNYLSIAIKSSQRFHYKRLLVLLHTWISWALILRSSLDGKDIIQRVHVVTDSKLQDFFRAIPDARRSDVRFQNAAHCGNSHGGRDLTCKIREELRSYFLMKAKFPLAAWFCHFDDDVYVNIVNLVRALQVLGDPYSTAFYVGKVPVKYPNGLNLTHGFYDLYDHPIRMVKWLTGQALCLSQKLMLLMEDIVMKDSHPWNFLNAHMDLPDDMLMQLVINEQLNIPLTNLPQMYEPGEDLSNLNDFEVVNAITLPHMENSSYIVPGADSSSRTLRPGYLSKFYDLHRYVLDHVSLDSCSIG